MSGIGRASAIVAAGTMVSRATGIVRTIVLVYAIGSIGGAGDAFATADRLPNSLFAMIQVGLLAAVIIPQIVKASVHKDGGNAYISKLFTLGTVIFLAITALAMLFAPVLVFLYASSYTPEQHALATAFAYWCLPQIFLYGMFALVGETLNARRIFGPYAWAPIANNLVSIAGFVLFIVLFGSGRSVVEEWTPGMIALIGATATFGIAVQVIVLMFAWRRTGLKLRPDFRWRGVGLGEVGRIASWTFSTTIVLQIFGILEATLVSAASGEHPAIFMMQAAWLVFILPHSIFAISISTPYYTQVAEHHTAGRFDQMRTDLGSWMRAVSLFIVISAVALAAAAIPATRVFTNSAEHAVLAAPVLIAYLIGLLPFSLVYVMQRVYFAYGDSRTPFLYWTLHCLLAAAGVLIASATVPLAYLAASFALVQSLASIVQLFVATWLLRRKIGGLDLRRTSASLLRFGLAAVPAGAAGWGVFLLLGGTEGWMLGNQLLGAVGTAIIGGIAVIVYLGVLALLRAPELTIAKNLLARLRPGRG